MTIDLVAFLDESKKPVRNRATGNVAGTGSFYVVAGVTTFDGEIQALREQITKVEGGLGFELHYGHLRTANRRIRAVEAVATITGWEASVFESAEPIRTNGGGAEHRIRAKALEAAFVYLGTDGGVDRAVLETRSEPSEGFHQLDNKDHSVLQRLVAKDQVPGGFSISHANKDEPLLKLADVVAGARTDLLCGKGDECYAHLSHLVDKIEQVR